MSLSARVWIAYVLAFIGGLMAAWAIMALTVGGVMAPRSSLPIWATTVFPPLGGLAVFSLIYGLPLGLRLGARFWVGGLALVAGVMAVAMAGIWRGYVTPVESTVLAALVIFAVGRLIVVRPDA